MAAMKMVCMTIRATGRHPAVAMSLGRVLMPSATIALIRKKREAPLPASRIQGATGNRLLATTRIAKATANHETAALGPRS